jgi:hypothetical protein
MCELAFIVPESGCLLSQNHNATVQYAHLVRAQGLGIRIRSASSSSAVTLTHRISVQAAVHIGTNVSYRRGVWNWTQGGMAS